MKIILLQDIEKIGIRGEIKAVKPGYFRNFLLPRNLAIMATKKVLENAKRLQQQKVEREEKKTASFTELIKQLESKTFIMNAKTGKEGVLFAGIHALEIAKLLQKEGMKNIQPESIKLPEPIKKTGSYDIQLQLTDNLTTKIKLEVQAN